MPAPEHSAATAAEFRAPAAWQCIDFLSDLHLSEATPRTFEALATHLRCTQADAVFILGDLFEVWVGDDGRHDGFEAECCAMLSEATAHRFIAFMAGNRDFLVGHEMLLACGVAKVDDPTTLVAFGQRLLLSHGDALCLADTDYQRFRAEVRSNDWQMAFLSQPLPKRREVARQLRAESERRKRELQPEDWADLDPEATREWMVEAQTPQLVHGHTHMPATHILGPGLTRYVLSDWDHDHLSTPRGDVLRWTGDGLARISPATSR